MNGWKVYNQENDVSGLERSEMVSFELHRKKSVNVLSTESEMYLCGKKRNKKEEGFVMERVITADGFTETNQNMQSVYHREM